MVGLVEEGVRGARDTVHQLPWSRWKFSMPEDPVRYPFTRAVLVGCRVHQVLASGVLWRSAGQQVSRLQLAKRRLRGFGLSRWHHRRGHRRTYSLLQRSLRGSTRVAGHTLNVRQKGMRGRLLWFTPLRPARELKTAKIGRGHGGSTQPMRVLGSRVAHSESLANTMRGRVVGGHADDTTHDCGSSKGTHL